jgi:membrane associated rhomboid family serine protease
LTDGDYDVKRCGKCAAWIPTSATMCAYCGTSSPDAPPARPKGSMLSLRHGVSVTSVLVVANAVYFVFSLFVQYTWTPDGNPVQWATTGTHFWEGLYTAGMYVHGAVVEDHEWWRVLCATFLHIGGIHILLNMLALRQLGRLAEDLFGPAKFLTVYVVSGVGCSLAISVWYAGIRGLPASQIAGVAGASGAIFGVAGLLIVYLFRAGTDRGRQIAMSIAKSVGMMLVIGLVVPGLLSQVGHVGGLLPGLAFGLLIKDDFAARVHPASRRRWTAAAAICVAAVAVSLLAGAWSAFTHLGGR